MSLMLLMQLVFLKVVYQAKYPQRNTLIAIKSRALTLQTPLQMGFSSRVMSLVSSAIADPDPELEPVRPQSHKAVLFHHDTGKGLVTGLGSETIMGSQRSIRCSLLCLDHQVSLYNWTTEEKETIKGGHILVHVYVCMCRNTVPVSSQLFCRLKAALCHFSTSIHYQHIHNTHIHTYNSNGYGRLV